jgi:hypothetical protein
MRERIGMLIGAVVVQRTLGHLYAPVEVQGRSAATGATSGSVRVGSMRTPRDVAELEIVGERRRHAARQIG